MSDGYPSAPRPDKIPPVPQAMPTTTRAKQQLSIALRDVTGGSTAHAIQHLVFAVDELIRLIESKD